MCYYGRSASRQLFSITRIQTVVVADPGKSCMYTCARELPRMVGCGSGGYRCPRAAVCTKHGADWVFPPLFEVWACIAIDIQVHIPFIYVPHSQSGRHRVARHVLDCLPSKQHCCNRRFRTAHADHVDNCKELFSLRVKCAVRGPVLPVSRRVGLLVRTAGAASSAAALQSPCSS